MAPPKECPSVDIMNVREIIEYAFGDFDDNKVNFKLVQTVLLLIARQLRVLERRVLVEIGPYVPLPPEKTLSITEVKVHATKTKGKKKTGQQSSGSEKTSTDKTSSDKTSTDKTDTHKKFTDKTATDKTSTDKKSSSTDKTTTSTDQTSTDKTKSSTDKTSTSTDQTSTDKTTSSTDKPTTTSTDRTSTDKTTSSTDKPTTTSFDRTSTDKTRSSTDKTTTKSTDWTSTDKTMSSTDKPTHTPTDRTSTDKTTSATDKKTTTSTDRTFTDKTMSSTDKPTHPPTDRTSTDKTTSATDKKTTTSTDRTFTDKTTSSSSRTAAAARGQKSCSNPDILSALEEQRERELRVIHQRADSFEEAATSPTPMASVSSIPKSETHGRRKISDTKLGTKKKEEEAKQHETLLVVKKVPSKESRTEETGQQRSPHISVVTQEQFEELAKAVRQLEKKFLPIGTPGFPEHAELMEELRKGASLTDAMAALQLSARLEATEKVIAQMITMITGLASQPPVVGLDDLTSESKKLTFGSAEIGQSHGELDGQSQRKLDGQSQRGLDGQSQRGLDGQSQRGLDADVGVDGVSQIFKAGPEETSGIGGTAKRSQSQKSPDAKTTMGFLLSAENESDDESQDSVYINYKDLRHAARELYDELLKKLKAETTRTTTTAETAYHMSLNLETKLDRAFVLSSRMTELENAVKQYADQVIALDTGLTSQMTSYQEQLTQMQHDLEIGVETISDLLASSSGDVEAVAELHSNFTNLQTDLEVMAFRQKELKDSLNSTAYDLENLWKEIEMLRDMKSDREEVADALRDKAGISQLNGLVALQQFEAVRGDFEKRIGAAYDKFNNQELIWQKAIDELIKVLNEKADIIQVETLRDDIYQHLNRIKARIQIITDIVGEPKSAMVSKKVFRDTSCLSCGSPALMDLEEPSKVPALPKFPSGREPAEGAEGESQTKGGGDSRLCYPDMPIPHPRDPRSHICKRYCGGSHTNITDGLNRALPGLVVQQVERTFNTAPGTDGKLYMVDDQTKKVPCLACNIPTLPTIKNVPEPPKQDPIDECGIVSETPPAHNVSY